MNAGNKTAIAFGEKKISYNELIASVSAFSKLVEPGESKNCVVFSENRPAWIYAFYGIWERQCVAVPIDYLATTAEVAYILGDCNPATIFCSADKQEVMASAIALAGIKTHLFILDDIEQQTAASEVTSFKPVEDTDETAVIIYTSGTTGSPKGVMLSYTNIITNIRAVSHHIPIYSFDSKVMVLLPLHHVFPLVGTMAIPLYLGATIAISPSMAGDDIMRTLQTNAITIIIGVPRLYAAIRKGIMDKINKSAVARLLFTLASKIKSEKFSKIVFGAVHRKLGGAVECLVSGGAALDPLVGRDFQTLGFEVLEGYGMTEAAPMITFTQPHRVRIGSPGEVMKETLVRIEDGEILASGPNIMKGYYNRPDETAEVLQDGWLYTGDLGYIDKDGYLYITGRKKEIIVLSNGKNVNPSEIEEQILQSQYVSDCGLFFDNELLQAIIVPDNKAIDLLNGRDADDIIRHEVIENFNKSVSSYKKIMRFYLSSDELPRTRLGKLQRFRLREMAVEKPDDTVETSNEIPEYRILADYLESEKGRRVRPGYHLEMDLGMDSLDKISLQAWLNQNFGIQLEPAEMNNFRDVNELANYIADHKTRMEEGKINWTDILREKVNLKLPDTWFTGRWMVYLSRAFFHLYFRFRATGLENIPEGPFILAPNHQSSFDGLFVAAYLQRHQIRKTYFYAKEKHIRKRWLKFLANRNNIIIVDLNKELKESIQKMAEVLKQKRNLIIFPEGTRTTTGELGEFKKTFAILSRELNIPVVPVSINGAFRALPKGSHFPRPFTKVTIRFLKPVLPGSESYNTIADEVKSRIEESLK